MPRSVKLHRLRQIPRRTLALTQDLRRGMAAVPDFAYARESARSALPIFLMLGADDRSVQIGSICDLWGAGYAVVELAQRIGVT